MVARTTHTSTIPLPFLLYKSDQSQSETESQIFKIKMAVAARGREARAPGRPKLKPHKGKLKMKGPDGAMCVWWCGGGIDNGQCIKRFSREKIFVQMP